MSKSPVRIAITGAAGQIGYSLVFRTAAGAMLGPDQPVILQLLEIPEAVGALEGVAMELQDCAFPLLQGIETSADPTAAFTDANWAILVGSRPRTKGMERKDLLEANGAIFTVQGKALSEKAASDVRVLVVGNPANTNCLIAMNNAPDIPKERFTALTRLDHNRAMAQLALKLNCQIDEIKRMTIWGNHSATQYPDLFNCQVNGATAATLVEESWIADDFIPKVQQRGAAIIEARGASSAASAANAAIGHVRDFAGEITEQDWVSMSVCSDGSYGVPEGLISSFPCTTSGGEWEVVQGLEIGEFSQTRIDATVAELSEEKEAVASLGLI